MKAQEFLHPKGELDIVILDPNGNTKEKFHVNNLVVQAGRDFISDRIIASTKPVMTHKAVGTGTDAADLADTALDTELHRQVFDSATRNANVVTFVTTYAPGDATGAITEAGIFNASSGGEMLCRTEFNVVNKAADDTMIITWTVTIS
jgi:hypothetical protein